MMGDPPSKWGRCYWVENNTAPGRSGRVRIKKHLRKSLRAPYLLLQLSLKSLGKRYNPINISRSSFWKCCLEYLFARHGLRRYVRARTRAICGRTRACACEMHSEMCVRCACVRTFFGGAKCDRTFAHFAAKWPEFAIFQLFLHS